MSERVGFVTFTNMQRDLEASVARHLDLARRFDAKNAELARVKAERDKWKAQLDRKCRKLTDIEEYGQVPARWCLDAQAERDDARAKRDEALQHLEAVLASSITEFDGVADKAREFLSAMREKGDDQ